MRIFLRLAMLASVSLAAAFASGPGPDAAESLDSSASARAGEYLRQRAGALGLPKDLNDLRLVEVREGLSAVHVRYQQTFGGVPVFGSDTSVSLAKGQRIAPKVTSRYRAGIEPVVTTATIDERGAISLARNAVSDPNPPSLRGEPQSQLIYTRDGSGQYVLAWQVLLPTLDPLGTWLIHLRADDGRVLLKENVLRFDGGQVFDPNPAKTSATVPPPSECDTGPQETSLAGEYRERDLMNIDPGQDKLKGAYVDLTAITDGYKPAGTANEPGRSYVYPCTDDRFEEVMVYYQVDDVQRKIQSLGFTGEAGIYGRPIPAHAHYFTDCNAFYDPINRGIHFGDSDQGSCNSLGSPPDTAEDAEVIVHEYGHAIQDDQVPGWGFGTLSTVFQALSMGEGFGDFLAAAIFGDACLGEWASFGRNACGGGEGLRNLENGATYNSGSGQVINLPTWCSSASDVHCSGLVWGAALWDLVQALPGGVTQANRDLVLQLVLDSHFYLDPQASFGEAAGAIRSADLGLYGGNHLSTIDAVFTARGITPADAVDFPYAYINIRHPYSGDLDVNLIVGSQTSPDCTINVTDRDITEASPDLVGFLALDDGACAGFLPPAAGQTWWLQVRDGFNLDEGTIEDFQVVLSGTQRCLAVDTPIAVPDSPSAGGDGKPGTNDDPFGPFVYSGVDCTTQSGPPVLSVDTDGDTIPDVTDDDDDNDSRGEAGVAGPVFMDAVEFFIGTGQAVACASTSAADDEADDGWPPDLNDDRRASIADVLRYVPVFNANDGDAAYRRRFDFDMDGHISLADVLRFVPHFNEVC